VDDPSAGSHTSVQWFNTDAFQRLDPALNAGQFGNSGRVFQSVQSRQFWFAGQRFEFADGRKNPVCRAAETGR